MEPRTTNPITGGLDLPTNATTVAWWASGASPGEPTGTVVLAAHVDYQGHTSPFTHLNRLKSGATVVVTDTAGRAYHYRVTGSRYSPKAGLDRAALFTTTGPPALALVTCGGPYNQDTHSFRDNLVVTAAPA